jgi:hypothetical protein
MDRPTRKSSKRKLEQDFEHENQSRHKIPATDGFETHQKLTSSIQSLVDILNSTFSSLEADRAAAKRATSALSQIAKNGTLFIFLDFFIKQLFNIVNYSYYYHFLFPYLI